MDIKRAELLAEKVIQLDLIRDELYEELLEIAGNQAFEILRGAQNTKMKTKKVSIEIHDVRN